MESIATKTVAQIVANNYRTADVFKKYGIDFCCGGSAKVAEVCRKNNISVSAIADDLKQVDQQIAPSQDFINWDLDFLVDYIIQNHHRYVIKNIPLICQYGDKVAKVHGHMYEETIQVNRLFHDLAKELSWHLQKEEEILFPYVKKLTEARKAQVPVSKPAFGNVQNPISMMETEHDHAGTIFKKIAQLTNNYTPPEGACNTFKVFYAKLQEFEADLHQHVHLENNILFPRVLKLEAA